MIYSILSGIISSLSASFWDVYYKKALKISGRYISDSVYQFIGYGFLAICLLIIAYIVEGGLGTLSLGIVGLFIISSAFNVVVEYLEQYAFRHEKMWVLAPYSEAHTLFASVMGFLFFSDSSLIAFLSALLGATTLMIGSVNFKKLKINRYCIALLFWGVLTAIRIIIFWVVLEKIAPLPSIFFSIASAFIIITLIILIRKEFHQVLKSPLKLNKLIFAEGFFWIFWVAITLYLIKAEWVVQAVLSSMIYLAVAPIISYYFFGDRPKRKDIYIIAIIIICVLVGNIFGNGE